MAGCIIVRLNFQLLLYFCLQVRYTVNKMINLVAILVIFVGIFMTYFYLFVFVGFPECHTDFSAGKLTATNTAQYIQSVNYPNDYTK